MRAAFESRLRSLTAAAVAAVGLWAICAQPAGAQTLAEASTASTSSRSTGRSWATAGTEAKAAVRIDRAPAAATMARRLSRLCRP